MDVATFDNVVPGEKWEFDQSVTEAFDDMLARSIPQYEVMRQAVFEMGKRYFVRNTHIVDLGCSRGEALAPFVDKYGCAAGYYAIDISDPMLEAAGHRFRGMINTNLFTLKKMDLRKEYPPVLASLTLSILTLQFTPIEHRLKILKSAYDHTRMSGAFILVEKVLGSSAEIDANLVDIYYQLKRENGYSQEQIERKRLSLEGVLVPVTAKWNKELLRMAGFSEIECFWRWMNFAAWVAVKE